MADNTGIAENLLQGTTIRMTALTKADLPSLAAWFADAGFLRLYDAVVAVPLSEDDLAKRFVGPQGEDHTYRFAVRPLDGEKLLGFVELDGILWSHGVAGLSIAIGDRANWGKGIGHEALRLALDFAFREVNLHRVQLTVFEYNQRAIALYEKTGFRREGTFREFLQRDGQRYDMHLYGLLRAEWKDLT